MAVYFYMSDSTDGWRNLATDSFFLENLKKEAEELKKESAELMDRMNMFKL